MFAEDEHVSKVMIADNSLTSFDLLENEMNDCREYVAVEEGAGGHEACHRQDCHQIPRL